ncbi:MAG: hypothetical protein ACERKZ_16190 [Lachnotalea sp.]
MKTIKTCIITTMIMAFVLSVSMTSTCFAAVKDYSTLQWDVNLDQVDDNPNNKGTIKITLTGVVGEQIDNYNVKTAVLPNPYYYIGAFVGHPDYSPKDINVDYYAPITGWWVYNSTFGNGVIAPKDKVAQTLIELAEKANKEKVTNVKLIPIVEGATMTVELVNSTYFQFWQFHYEAFPGTNPLLMTAVDGGGVATHYFQFWADEGRVASNTFKKITNLDGSFRIYPFPDEYNTQKTPIAFYVVTEAEAKALMANPNNLPSEMKAYSTATPTASKVLVNDKAVSFDAYNINGNNYFKLRDLAKVLSGTDKQFSVGYDSATSAIALTSGKSYTDVGGELSVGDNQAKTASASGSQIYVNRKNTQFAVYMIGGNNYFKLRDVAKAFDIGVGYDVETKAVSIDTKLCYWKAPVRVEAETNTILTGNAIVAEHAYASGRKAVINIYQVGDSLTFKDCPPAKVIAVRYAKGSEGDGVLSLYINGKQNQDITFPNTGGWDRYKELYIEMDIPEDAKMMFKLDQGDLSTNIDSVDFYEYGLGD